MSLTLGAFLQYLFSGLTVGAIYAIVGLGFSIIYNASHVINFAQGEFLMLGGMITVSLIGYGLPLPLAIALAVAATAFVGVALKLFTIGRVKNASVVSLIIITIGASIFLRGLAQVVWDKNYHRLPAFSGEEPIQIGGAALNPQSLWVIGSGTVLVLALRWFFGSTLYGKAMLATAANNLAARLVGIDTTTILTISFGLSAALGALAGILIAPISLTYYNAGVMLGLKGFAAAILGGLGSSYGVIVGGVLLGIIEQMCAGLISSSYKDAVAFVIILLVLFIRPSGLFGQRAVDRV